MREEVFVSCTQINHTFGKRKETRKSLLKWYSSLEEEWRTRRQGQETAHWRIKATHSRVVAYLEGWLSELYAVMRVWVGVRLTYPLDWHIYNNVVIESGTFMFLHWSWKGRLFSRMSSWEVDNATEYRVGGSYIMATLCDQDTRRRLVWRTVPYISYSSLWYHACLG